MIRLCLRSCISAVGGGTTVCALVRPIAVLEYLLKARSHGSESTLRHCEPRVCVFTCSHPYTRADAFVWDLWVGQLAATLSFSVYLETNTARGWRRKEEKPSGSCECYNSRVKRILSFYFGPFVLESVFHGVFFFVRGRFVPRIVSNSSSRVIDQLFDRGVYNLRPWDLSIFLMILQLSIVINFNLESIQSSPNVNSMFRLYVRGNL